MNSDDFGTLITQNAYNVRIAFNKGSSYMQFDSTAITMYTGTITDNPKKEHDLTTTELISIVTDIMSEKSERTR